MLSSGATDSLYRKVVGRYLGFGLICVCFFVFLAYAWVSFAERQWLIPCIVAVPLLILWAGGFAFRHLLHVPDQIFVQLDRLSRETQQDPGSLTPILEATPLAQGWNRLLDRITSGGLPGDIEDKLASALNSSRQAREADVLNSLTDGIVVSDDKGYILRANRAIQAILVRDTSESLENQRIQTLLLETMAGTRGLAERLRNLPGHQRFETQRTDDPVEGVYRVSCAPVVTETGQTTSYIWTVRDITQQRLAEQMRTEFVETATHELRTPLANIKAYAETLSLADDIPVEDQKEFFNIINSESTRLARFVDELLNLSQMDAGSLSISRHETDFERLLQEAIEHSRPQMESRNQTFETRIPPKLPKLNIDKDKVAACLVNLLGNASKYTPEGGTIRLHVDENSSELEIRVEDTGFGISEEELPRVFNRFFRSDDERVREQSGSGLGLAYTQEVARLHGGRLTAQSQLGKGSQFTFYLPH
jgi:two-component system phosphate regulon sensor histidine kinase PhoR